MDKIHLILPFACKKTLLPTNLPGKMSIRPLASEFNSRTGRYKQAKRSNIARHAYFSELASMERASKLKIFGEIWDEYYDSNGMM